MSLPPELINRILGHLGDDSKSLRAASLVSRAWTGWSQARLFKSVHLTPLTLNSWLENVYTEANGPALHTRTLTLEEDRFAPWVNPQYLTFPFLTSFRDVKSLCLIKWNATLFDGVSPEPYFGHFDKSLRAVSLQSCTFDPAIFFDFLSLLPNVDDLEIENLFQPSDAPDTIPEVPAVTPNFCGTLSLDDLSSGHLILKAIVKLPLHFSTIKIQGCASNELDLYQPLLTSCRDTLVTLHYKQSFRNLPLPDLSLESCNKLEEVRVLSLGFMKLPRSLETLFSSITSQKLQKISLAFFEYDDFYWENESEDGGEGEGEGDDEGKGEDENEDEGEDEWSGQSAGTIPWGSWDMLLSRLAHQVHNVEGKLTLQLNIRRVSQKPFKLDHFFPKFLGHGGSVDIAR